MGRRFGRHYRHAVARCDGLSVRAEELEARHAGGRLGEWCAGGDNDALRRRSLTDRGPALLHCELRSWPLPPYEPLPPLQSERRVQQRTIDALDPRESVGMANASAVPRIEPRLGCHTALAGSRPGGLRLCIVALF